MTEAEIEQKRKHAGEKKPSMKRRSEVNNYYGHNIYMLTMAVEGRRQLLGSLQTDGNDPATAYVRLTELGRAVRACWQAIPEHHPEVKILAFQMMPDHIHGVLQVKEAMQQHLGQVVSGFKAGCNKAYRRLFAEALQPTTSPNPTTPRPAPAESPAPAVPAPAESQAPTAQAPTGSQAPTAQAPAGPPGPSAPPPMPAASGCSYEAAPPLPLLPSQQRLKKDDRQRGLLFERGYNDLISKSYDMLPRLIAYVHDNPRRLAIRRAHPDYFRVRFGVTVGPQTYTAIGNRFLLTRPERVQVQLTRRLTPTEIAEQVSHFLGMARQGTLLVSPAISDGERAVMRAVLDAHLPLVYLSPWGFNSYSRPGHQFYDACSEGRLLILAPWPHQNERIPLTRDMCLMLNSMAHNICQYDVTP